MSKPSSSRTSLAKAGDLRRLCLALEGQLKRRTPTVWRFAFNGSMQRLSADGKSAHLKFLADEQAHYVEMHGDLFSPVPGGWGRMGWTTVLLNEVPVAVLSQTLHAAWTGALPTSKRKAEK